MRSIDIETRVLSIIDQVMRGQPNEDFRVELKAEWPEVEKAARRIAGHANAARGEPILWLIGVDEKRKTVVGVEHQEFANWYPSVGAQFDGLPPHVTDLNIPVDGKIVTALLFETDRAPFVVKNPAYGQKAAGAVKFEVPWREATSTRSATRADLLRLMTPMQKLPDFELLSAHLACDNRLDPAKLQWHMTLRGYVVTTTLDPVILPFHRCTGSLRIEPWIHDLIPLPQIHLNPEGDHNSMIQKKATEVVINHAGILQIGATIEAFNPYVTMRSLPAQIHLTLRPARTEAVITIDITLSSVKFDITAHSIPGRDRIDAEWSYYPT